MYEWRQLKKYCIYMLYNDGVGVTAEQRNRYEVERASERIRMTYKHPPLKCSQFCGCIR